MDHPHQKVTLERTSHDLLDTTARVGDRGFLTDKVACHYVEEDFRVVVALKFEVQRDSALISVKAHVDNRVESVCPDGIRVVSEGGRQCPL